MEASEIRGPLCSAQKTRIALVCHPGYACSNRSEFILGFVHSLSLAEERDGAASLIFAVSATINFAILRLQQRFNRHSAAVAGGGSSAGPEAQLKKKGPPRMAPFDPDAARSLPTVG